MNIWLTMMIAGGITYAMRLSFILLFGRMEVPESVRKALRLVPSATLTAIILPELFFYHGAWQVSLSNARLVAGILAALVAWRTKNVFLTILVGMVALWVLQLLV